MKCAVLTGNVVSIEFGPVELMLPSSSTNNEFHRTEVQTDGEEIKVAP